MKLFSPDNAHWYRRNGEPMHTVLSLKGEPRPTTLRDARKFGLLPSVTNVLGVVAKPDLIDWKMEQAVLAALTLPRRENESLDDFARRVVEDSQSRGKMAADFGTAYHAAADQIARGIQIEPAGLVAPWLDHHRAWFKANCVRLLWTERTLVNHQHGYAGTADLLIEHQAYGLTLVDYKTQQVKSNNPRAYPSWCYQLAAYRRALGQPITCLNLIINSTEPGPPVEHVWTDEELAQAWTVFEAAQVIWRAEKSYDPREQGNVDCDSQPTTVNPQPRSTCADHSQLSTNNSQPASAA